MAAEAMVLFMVLLVIYLLPAEMAASRKHYQAWTIFWLNLLLGWTVVAWIVALVWAATNPIRAAAPAPTSPAAPTPPPSIPIVHYETVNAIGPDRCPKCWKQKEGTLPFCRHCGASFR